MEISRVMYLNRLMLCKGKKINFYENNVIFLIIISIDLDDIGKFLVKIKV